MVAAVHLLEPGRRPGDATILRERVRPWTMAAETVLHDLGVIPILSSDSQGMGRVGETLRRAFQCAAVMKAQRGSGPGPADNERVLRHLAKVTINPAIAHGLSAHVGSLQVGRLADMTLWWPRALPGQARARAQGGHAGVGRLGRRQRDDDDGRAGQRPPADRRHRRRSRPRDRSRSWPTRRWTPTSPSRAPARPSRTAAG